MSKITVYLEASKRTQDLLNIKWALRSAGYTIGSSWHEADAGAPHEAAEHHWSAKSVEQLKTCDSLVVICEKSNDAGMELATMAGFALAHGLRVTWIGPAVRGLTDFGIVQLFNTAEEFRRAILRYVYSPSRSSVFERLAA